MDKLSNISKGGWRPSGDKQIHRATWKQDLKGMASRNKHDPNETQLAHQSAPLSSLRDPDSFGPPPKHSAYYGPNASSPTIASPTTAAPTSASSQRSVPKPAAPSGGWGSPVPTARPRQAEQAVEEPPKPPEPHRANTTGLRTDNLPKPPTRAGTGIDSPASHATPSLPPRIPPRQAQAQTGPPPILPPRQNEYPDEYTPAPPPPYAEATRQPLADAASTYQGAVNRPGQAGVSVPGSAALSPARGPQLNELQQRFARMNTGANDASASAISASPAAIAAQKKPPPPKPVKKSTLTGTVEQHVADQGPEPPPLPLSSKPKPT